MGWITIFSTLCHLRNDTNWLSPGLLLKQKKRLYSIRIQPFFLFQEVLISRLKSIQLRK